jgi:hypothetical protein
MPHPGAEEQCCERYAFFVVPLLHMHRTRCQQSDRQSSLVQEKEASLNGTRPSSSLSLTTPPRSSISRSWTATLRTTISLVKRREYPGLEFSLLCVQDCTTAFQIHVLFVLHKLQFTSPCLWTFSCALSVASSVPDSFAYACITLLNFQHPPGGSVSGRQPSSDSSPSRQGGEILRRDQACTHLHSSSGMFLAMSLRLQTAMRCHANPMSLLLQETRRPDDAYSSWNWSAWCVHWARA